MDIWRGCAIGVRYVSDDAPSFNKRESNSDGWQNGSTNVPPELRALQPLQLKWLAVGMGEASRSGNGGTLPTIGVNPKQERKDK